jgi:N-acetylmuramoyl-L-alanine amidase
MKHVVITAGHGGKDSGAVNGNITEANIATEMRNIIAFYLQRDHNIKVTTDGEGNTNLSLVEAIALAKKGELAVEIHTNAAFDARANGVESISSPAKKRYAQGLSAAVSRVLGSKLRGDSGYIDQSKSARGRLGYVNQADGIILELFFISNATELKQYQEKKWLLGKELASTIAGF